MYSGNPGYPGQGGGGYPPNYGQQTGQQPGQPTLGFNVPPVNMPQAQYPTSQAPYPTSQQLPYPPYSNQQPMAQQNPYGGQIPSYNAPRDSTAQFPGAYPPYNQQPQQNMGYQAPAGGGMTYPSSAPQPVTYPSSAPQPTSYSGAPGPYGNPNQYGNNTFVNPNQYASPNAYGGSSMPPYQSPATSTPLGYPNLGTGSGYSSQSSAPTVQPSTTNYSAGQQTKSMAQYQGTVHAAPNFNANQDAEALRKAMRGLGCDEKAVISILCHRSNAQRQEIRMAFKTMYGKDLINELISELKGSFEDVVVALMYSPSEFDARELDYAMRGLGTDEATLIEIMTTRTNAEVQAIKYAFKMLFNADLEQALSGETSGHFRRMLVSLSVGGRDESNHTDRARAAVQAKDLYEAGEKCWGTDESAFNGTMVMTNPAQLQLVFEEYQKITGHDVEQAVRGEFSGDVLDGMLALIKVAKNRGSYFAERAYLAMKGLGTNDRALIRIIVSRCEKEMVQIKQEYQRMYKTSLENAVSSETSGKYKEGLLTLIRG